MNDLLRIAPRILRARGWRLYTGQGRLIDLWQYGGRAILGHKNPGLLRSIKNAGERGLFTPLPHFAEDRLYKALSVLLPGRSFRLYSSEASLYQAISAAGLEPIPWRPFLDEKAPAALPQSQLPVVVPVLPCPFPGAPAALAVDITYTDILEKLPPSQLLSPVVLLAAARNIHDLLAAAARGNPRFPKIEKAVKKSTVWKRQGIYLFYNNVNKNNPGAEKTNYAAVFRHFLESGFLLPPSPEEPAILPGELSPGEEAKLAAALQAELQ